MAGINYQWYFEKMNPSMVAILEPLVNQLSVLERQIVAFSRQSIQNTYKQQPNYTPNYYHPGWQDYSNHSWNNNQDQYFAPNYYHQDFQYPLSQQQEQKSNLEEILDRFLERNETRMNNQEYFAPNSSYPLEFSYSPQFDEFSYQQPPPQQEKISTCEKILVRITEYNEMSIKCNKELIRDWKIQREEDESQREQLVNQVNNCLRETLPSNTEEAKWQWETVILENGKEFQEVKKTNLKSSRSHEEDDDEVEKKNSKVWEEEENDEEVLRKIRLCLSCNKFRIWRSTIGFTLLKTLITWMNSSLGVVHDFLKMSWKSKRKQKGGMKK